jgi:tRNA-dihydrouridine synthase A
VPSVIPTPNPDPRRGRTRALSVAPMMDVTDRHFRRMLRAITRDSLLYTEMITTGALQHGDRDVLLRYDPVEHPVALQLGGNDPAALADCARLAEDWGYDEVNLNVGCPSDRVRDGAFGVCLMGDPAAVARMVAAMRRATSLPVTVKHRIGFDDRDAYDDLRNFVDVVADAGCDRFSVHARKAWLSGLSPKENREVPPLRYDDVHRLKSERPDLVIEINGGFRTLDAVVGQLVAVDAVMLGRAVWDDPMVLADVDRRVFGVDREPTSTVEVLADFLPYLDAEVARGTPRSFLVRALHHLWLGAPGARNWRRGLSETPDLPAFVGRVVDAGSPVGVSP